MHELIAAIRAAVAEGASAEGKQAGAQACRTILAALEAEPGKPLAASPASPPQPLAALAGLDLDRALDLVIARLRAAIPADKVGPAVSAGLRIQLVPARPKDK